MISLIIIIKPGGGGSGGEADLTRCPCRSKTCHLGGSGLPQLLQLSSLRQVLSPHFTTRQQNLFARHKTASFCFAEFSKLEEEEEKEAAASLAPEGLDPGVSIRRS